MDSYLGIAQEIVVIAIAILPRFAVNAADVMLLKFSRKWQAFLEKPLFYRLPDSHLTPYALCFGCNEFPRSHSLAYP